MKEQRFERIVDVEYYLRVIDPKQIVNVWTLGPAYYVEPGYNVHASGTKPCDNNIYEGEAGKFHILPEIH